VTRTQCTLQVVPCNILQTIIDDHKITDSSEVKHITLKSFGKPSLSIVGTVWLSEALT